MAKWKYKGQDTDKLAKVDKIRKQKRGPKAGKNQHHDPFELKYSKWNMESPWFRARVVEVHKRYVFVSPEPEDGQVDTRTIYLATTVRKYLGAKTERNLITVGDIVKCRPTLASDGVDESEIPTAIIQNRAPRTSKISRRDPMNAEIEHVLASNIDQLLIVSSFLKPRVRFGLIDRYLVLAEEQQVPAIIVLNKKDLFDESTKDSFKEFCLEMIEVYKSLGYPVHIMSALSTSSDDSNELTSLLKNKISMFSGHSGVGKSSIVNLFDPEIVQEVEDNPDIFYKGRHTTTYASFIKLKTCEGFVVDTPGIRSFLVGERNPIDLTYAFREMRPFMGKCKYRECSHIQEPECRIKELLEDGTIHPERYRSYRALLLGDEGREGRSGLVTDDDSEQYIEEFYDSIDYEQEPSD